MLVKVRNGRKPEMGTPRITGWQKKLLPFMIGMLTVLTLFFFIASIKQIYDLHSRIEQAPELDLNPALNVLQNNERDASKDKLDSARWKTLSILEGHALQRRYHQANVLLMSRVWTTYLGFVTGMILSLVGAAFILGKLREPESKLDAESTLWKFSLTTASPGLILALLGTILMVTTMVTHFDIEVQDGPLYTSTWTGSSQSETGPTQSVGGPEKILEKVEAELRAKETKE
jgi:hypothetical protein